MKKILETEHLLLVEFEVTDARFIMELVNCPTWLQYIGNRQIHTLVDAKQYLLNGPIASYRKLGFGLWKIVLKDTAVPIGMCGLIKRDFLEHTDIGYALLPGFEGLGYAYEAAAATLSYAAMHLGFTCISAITDAGNRRSIQLLQKLGMISEGNILMPETADELMLFTKHLKSDG